MPTAPKKAKIRAPRNRTIELKSTDIERLRPNIIYADKQQDLHNVTNAIICGDAFDVLGRLQEKRFNILFADPPYNLTKAFGKETFRNRTSDEYEAWLDSWLSLCV